MPLKKERVWLTRCERIAKKLGLPGANLQGASCSDLHNSSMRNVAERVRPNQMLLRSRSKGAPYKCPAIREALWQWFVDIRNSLQTLISPKCVLLKAKEIAHHCLTDMKGKKNGFVPIPVMNKAWLWRWRKDYGVSYRRPTARYKCSKEKLQRRLKAMWSNNFRVRYLAQLTLGHDLSDRIHGIDEKPIHFNEAFCRTQCVVHECIVVYCTCLYYGIVLHIVLYLIEAGSKNVGTLEIAGAPEVRLKANHTATRERVSIMTWVTSNMQLATCPKCPPVEVLFRAKTDRRNRTLTVQDSTSVSLAHAPNGSYREDNIIAFLKRWLDKWTPERAASNDYRILYVDAARSHMGDAVKKLAWDRGYVVLYHYGCTTGVAQVNDTDCHAAFEAVYLEFEQLAFNRKQSICPGDVNRTAQEVLEDVVGTWRPIKHDQGGWGHKRRGLSNDLHGLEDHFMKGEALDFWEAMDMANVREQCLKQVHDVLDKYWKEVVGASTLYKSDPDHFRKLVFEVMHDIDDMGILEHEGQELEQPMEVGEVSWETSDESSAKLTEDTDLKRWQTKKNNDDWVCADTADTHDQLVLVAQDGDDPEDVENAQEMGREMEHLRTIRDLAEKTKLPAVRHAAQNALSRLEHGFCSKNNPKDSKGQRVNRVLRRYCETRFQCEVEKLKAVREADRKRRQTDAIARALGAKKRKIDAEKKERQNAAKEELEREREKLSKEYTLEAVQGDDKVKKKTVSICWNV